MLNISYSKTNLELIIQQGEQKQNDAGDEKEKDSLGNLRGGNAGCITPDLEIIGTCSRLSVLRALGIQETNGPTDRSRMGFFPLGNAMEDKMAEFLGLSEVAAVKREEECPVVTQTPLGRPITGRPDFLVWVEDATKEKADFGIEFKTVCSSSTASKTYLQSTPKTEHLCQAGFYMKEKGVPYILTYWNPALVEPSYYDKKAGRCAWNYKIPPFRKHFYLSFKDGVLYYRDGMTGQETRTLITEKGLDDYYTLVDELLKEKEMGPRISETSAEGQKIPYSPCKYCAFQEACDSTTSFELWTDMCRSLTKC